MVKSKFKLGIGLAVIAAAILFTSCDLLSGITGKKETKVTVTELINADDNDVDFENAVYKQDASVDKAKTISNLQMGGKTLTVNVPGVTLKNISDAKIIAGAGIGDGDLNLEGCDISSLQILGGGANSIHVKNSKVEALSVEKEEVRVVLEEGTSLTTVTVASDNVKLEADAEAKIENIKIDEAVTEISITGGEIAKIESESEDVAIVIFGETKVEAIEGTSEVKVAAGSDVELPEEIEPETVNTDGTELTNEAPHMVLEAAADGIKITIRNVDGDTYINDAGGNINVIDKDIRISLTNNNVSDNDTEFVYPFVKAGEEVIIRLTDNLEDAEGEGFSIDEYAKITAIGGKDLSDYVKADGLEKWVNTKVIVDSDTLMKSFYFGLETELSSADEIFCLDKINNINQGGFTLMSGELDWKDTAWEMGNSIMESNGEMVVWSPTYSYLDLFSTAKKIAVPAMWGTITQEEWEKHDYHYCASCDIKFYIDEDTINCYALPTTWSELYTNPKGVDSTKNLDVEKALTDGVKGVTKPITNETELLQTVISAYTEYEDFFQPYSESRSAVTPSGEKAKSAAAALAQLSDFVTSAKKLYTDFLAQTENGRSFYKLNFDFDKSINIGELSFEDWIYAVGKAYDEALAAIYDGELNDYTTTDYFTGETGKGSRIYKYITKEEFDKRAEEAGDEYWWENDIEYKMYNWYYGTTINGVDSVCFYAQVYSSSVILYNIEKELSEAGLTLKDIFDMCDKYVTIKNAYVKLAANVDFDVTPYFDEETEWTDDAEAELISKFKENTNTLATADIEVLFDAGIVNINDAIADIIKISSEETVDVNLPVKAVAITTDASVKANITYADVGYLVEEISAEKLEKDDYDAEAYAGVTLKTAICTKDGQGGIITIDAAGKVKAADIIKYSSVMFSGENFDESALFTIFDDIVTLNVTVSDGTENTFTKAYDAESIMQLISSFMPQE